MIWLEKNIFIKIPTMLQLDIPALPGRRLSYWLGLFIERFPFVLFS